MYSIIIIAYEPTSRRPVKMRWTGLSQIVSAWKTASTSPILVSYETHPSRSASPGIAPARVMPHPQRLHHSFPLQARQPFPLFEKSNVLVMYVGSVFVRPLDLTPPHYRAEDRLAPVCPYHASRFYAPLADPRFQARHSWQRLWLRFLMSLSQSVMRPRLHR